MTDRPTAITADNPWRPPSSLPQHPEFYHGVLDQMPTPLIVVDDIGKIVYGNTAMLDLGGWTVEESIGASIIDHIHPEDASWVGEAFLDLVARARSQPPDRRRALASVHIRIIAKDGSIVPLEATASSATSESLVGGIIYDIRPARHQEFLTHVLSGVAAGTDVAQLLGFITESIALPPLELDAAVLEPAHDGNGGYRVVTSTSAELADALDGTSDPLPWTTPHSSPTFVAVDDLPAPIGPALSANGCEDLWHLAVESTISASTYRIVACSAVHHVHAPGVIDRLLQARELAGVVLLRAQSDQVLHHAATHDGLTGVANRSALRSRLGAIDDGEYGGEYGGDGGEQSTIGLIYVDLDGFKPINDRYGHAVGDDVLCVVADRLRAATRPSDVVARLGGDEFAVLLTAGQDGPLTTDELAAISMRICDAVRAPVTVGGGDRDHDRDHDPNDERRDDMAVAVTASIGWVMKRPTDDAERLLVRADELMYSAKRAGGNRVHCDLVEQPTLEWTS